MRLAGGVLSSATSWPGLNKDNKPKTEEAGYRIYPSTFYSPALNTW